MAQEEKQNKDTTSEETKKRRHIRIKDHIKISIQIALYHTNRGTEHPYKSQLTSLVAFVSELITNPGPEAIKKHLNQLSKIGLIDIDDTTDPSRKTYRLKKLGIKNAQFHVAILKGIVFVGGIDIVLFLNQQMLYLHILN